MTTRCEICPLQSFCTELVRADTTSISHYQAALAEVELQQMLVEDMAAEGESYLASSLDMDEHSSPDTSEYLVEHVAAYLETVSRQAIFQDHIEAVRATIYQLLASYTLSKESLEERLAFGNQLQNLIAHGCEQGPGTSGCNAPGAQELRYRIGAIPLELPEADSAA